MAYFEYLLNKNEIKFNARAENASRYNRIKCIHYINYALQWKIQYYATWYAIIFVLYFTML